MKPAPIPWDLTRILLAVVSIGGLVAASFWVLRPFLPAIIWAVMIVVATWPEMRLVQARLLGSRNLAVAVMTLAMLLLVVTPVAVATVAIVGHLDDIASWSRSIGEVAKSPPPEWVNKVPLVGTRIAQKWESISSMGAEDLAASIRPYLRGILLWVVGQAGGLGMVFVQFLLTLTVSAILYARGEAAAAGVLAFARRLAGQHGERAAILSAQAIRAVALGIVVTALVQSIVGGIGLAITGVPHAALLAAVMFILGVAQVGPGPVLIGAVAWLYWQDGPLWGTVMLVWSAITMTLDNILRPILIRKGADVPLLLIFAGVLGGLLAFGIVGLFVGPVVLAVSYTLLVAWVTEAD